MKTLLVALILAACGGDPTPGHCPIWDGLGVHNGCYWDGKVCHECPDGGAP